MDRVEFPMVDVIKLRPLGGHKLWVLFSTGEAGERDFADVLNHGGPMIEPLRDPAFFARAFIELGAIAWPNGYDIDPINLYLEMRDSRSLSSTAAAE